MPLNQIRYRPWEGDLRPPLLRLWAIPKYSLKTVADRKFMTTLFGFGSIGTLIILVYLYLFANPYIISMLGFATGGAVDVPEVPIDRLLRFYLFGQTFIALLIILLGAPKMISPELQHQALPLLYSRPLTRAGYVAGKMVAIALPLSYLFIIQTFFILIMMGLILPGTHSFWEEFLSGTIPIAYNALATGLLMTLVVSLVALACSAATKNHIFAAGIFLALYFGSSVFSKIAGELLGEGNLYIGLFDVLRVLPAVFVDQSSSLASWRVLLVLFCWAGAALGLMLWRLRPVEVHSG